MKSKIIKIMFIMIFGIIIFSVNKNVQANSISKIDMDIYVDNEGNAQITETWVCTANQGTEVYHPYYNLGNSKITNLTVSEGNRKYTTLNSWNTSGSLSSKAYKCGINRISNGVELCWGISEYTKHTYVVKYNISNFVSELNDSQMIYWTLIPYDFSNTIGDVNIKIHTNSYIKDTIDVWGYGNYGGLCYVNNGAIYMKSDGTLRQNEYMTILVKFPPETFAATNRLNKNFNYYYQMAQEGSTKYNGTKSKSTSLGSTISTFIKIIFNSWYIILGVIMVFIKGKTTGNGVGYGKEKRRLPKEQSYYRDIPCYRNLFRAYYVGYTYGIIKKKTDLLGAIILKWIKEGRAGVKKIQRNSFRNKEETAIVLYGNQNFASTLEYRIYSMLYEASGDGILEKRELEKWCRGKYSKILKWFDDVLEEERDELVVEGLIEKTVVKKFFTTTKYEVRYQLTEEASNLAGLKKYLLEYTLIKDREAIEVELFESYLIYAQLLGIAKQVSKEFKDLYPEMIEQSHYDSYDNVIFIHHCSTSGIASANSARNAAESYSGGGGGFSSGGGGGGSFGGGGGGGGFR